MFDAEVGELLERLDRGFPAIHELSAAQARALIAARRPPAAEVRDTVSAADVTLPTPAGELPARVYRPRVRPARAPGIVFCHGGGFVFCDLDSHDGFCRGLCEGVGAVVVSVGYRLAPEHRAPAAARDADAALGWLHEHAAELDVDPDRIGIAGDSVGGNLAAAACLIARDRGGPSVAVQALLYPVLDSGCDSPSYRAYATGHYNTAAAMEWYWRQYLPNDSLGLEEAYAVPARAGDLRGLPAAVILTAALDPLHDEGGAYADALRAAGVPALHRDYRGLFHGFLTIATLRAAAAARTQLWRDLSRALAPRRVAT